MQYLHAPRKRDADLLADAFGTPSLIPGLVG